MAGAGVYLPASEVAFESAVWGVADGYGGARLERCRAFMSVPGSLETVQRAEFWGAVLAMQACWPCHLGIDNLNVARTLGWRLDRDCLVWPLPLVKDGDLVALARYMIRTRGRETVRITEVKGHAEDSDVQQGRVRLEDQKKNWGMLRLMMPLSWVVVISLKFSVMLGVGCSKFVVIGILSCNNCIGS